MALWLHAVAACAEGWETALAVWPADDAAWLVDQWAGANSGLVATGHAGCEVLARLGQFRAGYVLEHASTAVVAHAACAAAACLRAAIGGERHDATVAARLERCASVAAARGWLAPLEGGGALVVSQLVAAVSRWHLLPLPLLEAAVRWES
jgi:hypothetical protein